MAVITISRQFSSLGDEIAEEIAKKLGYTLVDKASIHREISKLRSDFSSEIDTISEEVLPGFFSRLLRQRAVYVNIISSLIYEAVSRNNIVIKGRGGQFLLADQANVLNVRIVAPLSFRVSVLNNQQDIDSEIAEEIINKNDKNRAGFIRYLYEKEVEDSKYYDLIISSNKFDADEVVGILSDKAKSLDLRHPLSDNMKKKFKAMALKKLIEATLQKEMPNSNHIKVKSGPGGDVVISGYIGTGFEKEQAGELTKTVAGVTKVDNKIVVAHFPVTTWP